MRSKSASNTALGCCLSKYAGKIYKNSLKHFHDNVLSTLFHIAHAPSCVLWPNISQTGTFEKDMIPTVGFNMAKVQKGKVTIKIWDMGGQKKFRGMWERYCRGVSVIVFVIDAADPKNFPDAAKELKVM